MKISMWMLANRLSSLDLELHIKDNAGPVLKSARRAYATNCVFVYQDGNDLICEHMDDWIRIHDIPLAEGFELIQNVFDYYDDWYSSLRELTAKRNYDGVIQSCWPILNNPLLLLNGNRQVLGLSRQYEPESMDDEWRYLIKYGYSSVPAIRMWMNNEELPLSKPGIYRYSKPKGGVGYGGISCGIFSADKYVGRLTVLERDRLINPGDGQILEIIADVLRDALALTEGMQDNTENVYLLTSLLLGRNVARETIILQLGYRRWYVHDTYQLYLLELDDSELSNDETLLQMLSQMINRQLMGCILTVLDNHIVILHNCTRTKDWTPYAFLTRIAKSSHFHFSYSLPIEGMFRCNIQLRQAEYALKTGKFLFPEEAGYDFYNMALDFILESAQLTESAQAAHPDIIKLWKRKWETDDVMFVTMKEYLNNDRSLVGTAQALFIHRNTLVYRLKKVEEFIQADLDDMYTRDYMKLSIRILELIERQCRRNGLELNAQNVFSSAFPDYYPGLR